MRLLGRDAFERARRYIESEARPLDRALYHHRFKGAPPDEALAALKSYQNDDGGFGHALEPDVRTRASSAIATAVGLAALADVDCPATDERVERAVAYLRATLDPATWVWRIVPPAVNDAPHAPWWNDEGDSLAAGFGQFEVNPRAELLGLLWRYSALVERPWLEELSERTAASIEGRALDWHDLLAAGRLIETRAVPEGVRARLRPRLREEARRMVGSEPASWNAYGPQPAVLARSPDSPFAEVFPETLAANLDYVIARQAESGAWEPNWSWGPEYPDAWVLAKREWSGHLTLETLTTLRAFGRIEGLGAAA
jgi:hypothetical protein